MSAEQDTEFNWPVRVYYEDTDAGGVVYYANYLKYMERSRTEFLRQLGFEQDQLITDHGIMFVVREAHVEYHKPARFNDLIHVSAVVSWIKRASLQFKHVITAADQTVLITATVRVACVTSDAMRVASLPTTIKERLAI